MALDNWIITHEEWKPGPHLTPITKINSKCIKYLNVRPEYRALRDKHREYNFDIHQGKIFLTHLLEQ